MSRRNVLVIVIVGLVSLTCTLRSDHNRQGRYLSQVLTAIDRWALEPVDQHELFDAAMRGISGRLDEYSQYISAKDVAAFEAELEQEFGGIGVVVKREGTAGHLTVIQPPLFGTPALKAGIRVRDRILEIDGVSTEGMPMEDVMRRMRGRRGDPVEVTILHDGAPDPVRLRLVRDIINIPSVLGDARRADGSWEFRLAADPRIGTLRVNSFGEKTVDEIELALERLTLEKAEALVLDLRDNAGGLLTSAVETCDLFLPTGKVIVTIRGRHGVVEDVETSSGPGLCLNLPIVILVNRYTASAAEIVSACLQDHRRAVVVGERTWGKGTVQHVIPIESGQSILKLTAASYYRPSGQNIHRMKDTAQPTWGVAPDEGLSIDLTEEEEARRREERARRDLMVPVPPLAGPPENALIADRALGKAVQYLRRELELK